MHLDEITPMSRDGSVSFFYETCYRNKLVIYRVAGKRKPLLKQEEKMPRIIWSCIGGNCTKAGSLIALI